MNCKSLNLSEEREIPYVLIYLMYKESTVVREINTSSVAFACCVQAGWLQAWFPASIAGISATDFCVGSSVTYLYRALYSLRMLSKEGWEGWWHQELSDSHWFDKQSGRVRRDNDVVGMHHSVPAWTSVLWLMFGQKHPLPFLNSKSQNQHVKWVTAASFSTFTVRSLLRVVAEENPTFLNECKTILKKTSKFNLRLVSNGKSSTSQSLG